jgi:hypothetical protein
MARRIDIELTSHKDDATWTWRAPGARQPRGTVDAALLPDGAAVGDVLRAEAEFDLDGIAVTSVVAPREETHDQDSGRIEILGSGRTVEGVSVELAGGRRRDRGDSDRPRRDRGDSDRPRRDRSGSDRPRRDRSDDRGPSTAQADRPRPERGAGGPGDDHRERGPGDDRSERAPGAGRRERGAGDDRRPGRPDGGRGARPDRARSGRDRSRGITASATHRNQVLASLRPEQLPVAEQLLRGGIPAVRQAIAEQNERARTEGRAEVAPEPLLAMAEELLPAVSLATWKDRATAVRGAGRDAPLREVRSAVAAASTVSLDEEGRVLSAALREALTARITAMREAWVEKLTNALDDGRVADALRMSARPPEPAARVPAPLAVRLATATGEAMTAQTPSVEWLALLDAALASPVRRTVRPTALPEGADDELLATARRAAGQVPELARLLGLPIPPPPGPRRPAAAARRS